MPEIDSTFYSSSFHLSVVNPGQAPNQHTLTRFQNESSRLESFLRQCQFQFIGSQEIDKLHKKEKVQHLYNYPAATLQCM